MYPTCSLTIDLWITTTPNHSMSKYGCIQHRWPMLKYAHIQCRQTISDKMYPLFIDHRSLDHHYTKSPMSKYGCIQHRWPMSKYAHNQHRQTMSHMTYPVQTASLSLPLLSLSLLLLLCHWPHIINHTSLEHHYTKSVSNIEECTYTHGRCTSLDI